MHSRLPRAQRWAETVQGMPEGTHFSFIAQRPGWVAQLVRASSQCAKAVGLTPSRGTSKTQAMHAQINGTANRCLSQINQ